MVVAEDVEVLQAASPFSRVMHTPNFNLCVIGVVGFGSTLDVAWVKSDAAESLAKHPRFSSVLVFEDEKRYKMSWKPAKVNIDDHIFAPDVDSEMEPEQGQKFVEEFTKILAEKPMDLTKPLWELHLLNVKTTDSNATGIFKVHHSLGDGISMVSMVLACGRKISDPEALPVLPTTSKSSGERRRQSSGKMGRIALFFFLIWRFLLMIHYTLMDLREMLLTVLCFRDSNTPIKGEPGVEHSPKRYVHRLLDMDDVRLIKNSMKVTVNDVVFGVCEAALTRYLQRRYDKIAENGENGTAKKKASVSLKRLRVRGAVAFNMRPSASIEDTYEVMKKGKALDLKTWGNMVSFVIIPLKLRERDDPLAYVRDANALMNRKKLSCQSVAVYYIIKLIISLFGLRVGAKVINRFHWNVTFEISNVMGTRDEITLFHHPVNYLAPTVTGIPVSMVIHFHSYAKKLVVALALDEKLFPDPDQLCEDFQHSLQMIKDAAVKSISPNGK